MTNNDRLINDYLQGLDWNKEPQNLYQPIAYTLAQGGKRIRPHLCLLATEMFAQQTKESIHAAIAFEMLHNFTLIHDDIMDKSALRRGKETVYQKWNTNIAILSGDTLFAKGMELLLHYKNNQLSALTSLFLETMVKICEGQQMDMEFETQTDVKMDKYIQMITLKTAIMLGACLQAGAIIANTDKNLQQMMYDFGLYMGLGFQIQDDILDVYGNPDTFGKPIGGDINENKKTFLSICAMEANQGEDKNLLQQYFNDTNLTKEEKFENVKAIYDKHQVKAIAEKQILHFAGIALDLLSHIEVMKERKQPLLDFAQKLINRKY